MMGWFRLENGTNDLQTGWIGYIPNSTTAPPLPRPAGRPMDPHRWKAAIDSDGRNIGITFPKPTVLVNGDVVIGYESFILPYDESLPNRYFPNHAPSGAGYATDPREIEDRFDISPLLSDGSTPPSTNMGAIYGMAMPGAPAGGPYPNQIELLLHTKQDMDNDVNSIRTVRFDPTVDTPSTVSIMRREDYAESQLPAPYKLHLRPESEYTSYFGIDQGGTVASFCGKVWTNDPVNEIGANVFAVDVN